MAVPTGSLTTLALAKTELGITDSASDTILERMIGAATAYVSTFCRRTFHYETGIIEKCAGFGTPYIVLAKAPIVSITSITYDGAAVSSSNYEVYSAEGGILYAPNIFIWTAPGGSGISHLPKPGHERKLYTVTYTGGYITATQDNGTTLIRNLPYDLEDAVLQLVTWRFRNMGRDQSIASESLLNASVSYAMPFATVEVLKTRLPLVYDILRAYTFEPML